MRGRGSHVAFHCACCKQTRTRWISHALNLVAKFQSKLVIKISEEPSLPFFSHSSASFASSSASSATSLQIRQRCCFFSLPLVLQSVEPCQRLHRGYYLLLSLPFIPAAAWSSAVREHPGINCNFWLVRKPACKITADSNRSHPCKIERKRNEVESANRFGGVSGRICGCLGWSFGEPSKNLCRWYLDLCRFLHCQHCTLQSQESRNPKRRTIRL